MKTTEFIINHQGKEVFVEISPCSWMYANYGLQIKLAFTKAAYNAESVFTIEKGINAQELSDEKLLEKSQALALKYLSEKGITEIEAAVASWAETEKKFARDEKKEEEKHKKFLHKKKLEGFNYLFSGWIHARSGSDKQVEYLFKVKPTDADIKKILRGSEVKTDYTITEL